MQGTTIYTSVSASNEERENEPSVIATNLTLEGCIRDTKISDRVLAFEVHEMDMDDYQDFEITEEKADAGPWWHGYSESTSNGYFIQKTELGG